MTVPSRFGLAHTTGLPSAAHLAGGRRAGWFRYLAGTDERGGAFETGPALPDPLAARLTQCARGGGADPGALLGIREVFGDVLPDNAIFRARLGEALRGLYQDGTRATLAAWVASASPSAVTPYQQQ